MEKVLLQELAEALAKRKKISKKDADAFVRATFDLMEEALLADQLLKVKGLGTFKIVTVDSRESINVNTGERIVIDSHSKITYSPDKTLSDRVNRPFADFETTILNDGTKTEDMEHLPAEEQETEATEEVAKIEASKVEKPVAKPEPVVLPESMVETKPLEETKPVEEPKPAEETRPVEKPKPVETPKPVEKVKEKPAEKPQPVKEPKVAAKPQTTSANKQTGSSKKCIIVVILLLLALCLCLYFFGGNKSDEASTDSVQTEQVQQNETVVTDSLDKAPQPSLEELIAQYPQVKYGDYWIVGIKTTVVLEHGDDPTKLALKYLGDKNMLKYIMKINGLTTMEQANSLGVGREVKIPELVERTKE